MEIQLGHTAKDKVTGFEGTLVGRADYLYGCTQYCLCPTVDKDGKVRDSQWFDEGRIQVAGSGIAPAQVQAERPGGPNRDAPRI